MNFIVIIIINTVTLKFDKKGHINWYKYHQEIKYVIKYLLSTLKVSKACWWVKPSNDVPFTDKSSSPKLGKKYGLYFNSSNVQEMTVNGIVSRPKIKQV